VIDQARALTTRVADAPNDTERIRKTYRLVLQREPTPDERKLALDFIQKESTHGNAAAWPEYTQVLLISNEFTYLN
jgi:hypothetical protein